MSSTAYAATSVSAASGCRSRVRDRSDSPSSRSTPSSSPAGSTPPDALETCAAVARLGTSPEVLPELTRLLEDATGGPVALLSRTQLSHCPDGVLLPLGDGRAGALLLQPTVAAWCDAASPARIVLARLLESIPAAPFPRETVSAAAALLDDFEGERRELAERLHRGVLQSLIGSRYLFDLARTAEGRSAVEALTMAREAVQEALTEGRALLRDVTPRVGDRASLLEEAALLPGVAVTSQGSAPLSPVVAATAYRLLQAISAAGRSVTVSLTDEGDRLRLVLGQLTDCDGRADRGPSATGAGFVTNELAPHFDRLRLIGVRVVEDGEQAVLELPVAPRLPVQRAYRAAGRTQAGTTTSTTAPRPTQRALRRSEGNP